MIRKQIYLEERHQEVVRKKALAQGVSEAEVIRKAIEAQQEQRRTQFLDPAAWKRALALMRSQRRAPVQGRVHSKKWSREELYEDRLKRYGSRTR